MKEGKYYVEKNKDSIYDIMSYAYVGKEYPATYSNEFTQKYMKAIGFELNRIDEDYLERFVKYYDEIGFWK